MPVVVTDIRRADPAAVAELGRYGVATIHEAQGRSGLLSPELRPVWPGAKLAGSAVTVHAPPGDNWMIHVAVEQCQDGDVLVLAPISQSVSGYFGELLATALRARGVRGLVIDAGCRDVDELQEMGFPVFSRAISAHGTVKESLGDVNVPIAIGGQVIRPGDVVVADTDGVVIVPRHKAAEVAAASQAREEREQRIRENYQSGKLGLDLNNMRPRLAEKGLRYVSQAEWEKEEGGQ